LLVTAKITHDAAEAVMVVAGFEPLDQYPGAHTKWRCRCVKCGNEIFKTYTSVRTGHGCPICPLPNRTRKYDEDAAVTLMIAAGFEPLEPYPGTMQVQWRCRCVSCDREMAKTVESVQMGISCGFCIGQHPDLDEVVAKMKAKDLEPLDPYPGGKQNWRCRCMKCDRTVFPKYNNIDQGWGGCAHCSGRIVDPEVAANLMRAASLEPLVPYPGTQTKWKCVCRDCKKIVYPTYLGIQQGQGGCKYCSISGLKWDEPAVVYLVAGEWFHKVGIANNTTMEVRLSKHLRFGLESAVIYPMPTGQDAHTVEQAMIAWWRVVKGVPPLAKEELLDGWTETAENSRIPIEESLEQLAKIVAVVTSKI